jgi:hypothetical protein
VYVTPDDVFLWTSQEPGAVDGSQCDANDGAAPQWRGQPASVVQIPLSGAMPRALLAEGYPDNQFSLDVTRDEFRALLVGSCDGPTQDGDPTPTLAYFHAPLSAVRTVSPSIASNDLYRLAPSPGAIEFEARFTDSHVVYGGRSSWGGAPPTHDDPPFRAARLVAMPTDGSAPSVLEAPHEVIRIEVVGGAAVVTGYANQEGLYVSRIDLRGAPRISSTILLRDRFETEGRSHAFNSRVARDGTGYLALPTAGPTDATSDRLPYESTDSDISFVAIDAVGHLRRMGELNRGAPIHSADDCEVSCIDWYGNARPIFAGGRIFALTGADLVEGADIGGQIREVQRLRLEN